MKPLAILFDLDGTLLDTLADLAAAMNRVLAAEGLDTHPTDAYRAFVGEGVRALTERVLPPSHRSREAIARLMAAMREDYACSWGVTTSPYPGVPALLDGLVAHGVRLAVLSNKPDDFTRAMVAHYLGAWPFADVRGVREGGPRKPDPTEALEILAGLSVAPERAWFVGDTSIDVRTGLALGSRPVGVSWGFRPADELWAAGADAVLDAPLDLLTLLDTPQDVEAGRLYILGSNEKG